MILAHYTDTPLAFDPNRTYEQSRPTFKPTGFWLSVDGDDGWKAWCESELFRLSSLEYRAEFRIREEANVLRLATAADVHEFSERYRDAGFGGWVDWTPVIEQYDGILITPYLWALRFDETWYSTWDCSSGCFWNLDAIELASVAVAP